MFSIRKTLPQFTVGNFHKVVLYNFAVGVWMYGTNVNVTVFI